MDEEGRRRDSQAQAAMTNESDAGWSSSEHRQHERSVTRQAPCLISNTKTITKSERMTQ